MIPARDTRTHVYHRRERAAPSAVGMALIIWWHDDDPMVSCPGVGGDPEEQGPGRGPQRRFFASRTVRLQLRRFCGV